MSVNGDIIFKNNERKRKMDANELKEILDKHEKWLKGEPDGERAWLSGANLSNANLLGANLCQADLSYADLRNANLQDANLSRANLRSATLYCANLIKARLDYAFFG